MPNCTPTNRVRNQLAQGSGLRGFSQLSDVDSMIQHFFGPGRPVAETSANQAAAAWSAPASLWETETHFHVKVEAPGVSSEQVDISVEKDELTISLERKAKEADLTYLHNERSFGSVTRTVKLPETADLESIEAKLDLGVLSLSVAKQPEAKPRKIEVKTS